MAYTAPKTETPEAVSATCDGCGLVRASRAAKDGSVLAPKGWRDFLDSRLCDACWKKRFRLRAVTFAVLKPTERRWTDLRADLNGAWRQCARLSNWVMTEFRRRDTGPVGETAKIARWEIPNLYQDAVAVFPELPTATVSALLQELAGKYRAKRWQILTGQASLPTTRDPAPMPLRTSQWSPCWLDTDRPAITVSLCSTRAPDVKRYTLVLKTGKGFRRQLVSFRGMMEGAIKRAAASLYADRHGRVMAKLVMHLPKPSRDRARTGTLYATTRSTSFLVARCGGAEHNEWWLHGDHVRRWIAAHRRRLQRLSDDRKAEIRAADPMRRHREAICAKQADRLETFTHQAAAQLANYADRRRIATVIYDDQDQNCFGAFPYSAFEQKLRDKLDFVGIEFKPTRELREEALARQRTQKRDRDDERHAEEMVRIDALMTEIRADLGAPNNDSD